MFIVWPFNIFLSPNGLYKLDCILSKIEGDLSNQHIEINVIINYKFLRLPQNKEILLLICLEITVCLQKLSEIILELTFTKHR